MIVNDYKIEHKANLIGAYLHKADLYEAVLRGANLRGTDLRGADLRRADLRRADLYGADLRGAKGIMSFIGEKNLLVYFYCNSEHYFKIGCKTLPYKDWLKDYKKIGKENNYTNDQIELYGTIIKTFSKYDLSEV